MFFKHRFLNDLFQSNDQRILNVIDMLQSIKFSLDNPHYYDPFQERNHIKKSIADVIEEYELSKSKDKNNGSGAKIK